MGIPGRKRILTDHMKIWSFCFFFLILITQTSAQSNIKEPSFREHIFVAFKVANKNLGIRRITTDLNGQVLIPRGVIKTICNRAENPSCKSITQGSYWLSLSEMKRENIRARLDLLNFQIKILLPSKWQAKIKSIQQNDSDKLIQTYSFQYLKFIKDSYYGQDGNARLIRQIINLANPEAIRIFSKEEWFFPEKITQIVEGEDIYSSKYYNSTNTELMTIAKDIQENRKFTDSTGLSSLNGISEAITNTKNSSQADTKAQGKGLGQLGNTGKGSGSGRQLGARGSKSQMGRGNGNGSGNGNGNGEGLNGKNSDKLVYTREILDYHNHYNEEILEELRGMHSILMKMGQRAHLYNGHQEHLIKMDSLEIEENKNGAAKKVNVLDSLELIELEKKQIGELKDMDSEDIFKKAFGRKPQPKPMSYQVTLVVDEQPFESVKINFNEKRSEFFFESKELSGYLEDILIDEVIDQLRFQEANIYNSIILQESGFDVRLNEAEFRLNIEIPGVVKKMQIHDFADFNRFKKYTKIKPAYLSAFVNLNMNQDLFYNEVFIANDSLAEAFDDFALNNQIVRDSWVVRGDAAVNFMGWVGETDFSFVEPSSNDYRSADLLNSLVRTNTRLVRDIRPLDFRLTAGDINPLAAELDIVMPQLFGVNLNRRFGRMNQSRGFINNNAQEIEIVLDRPATVQMWLNGKLIKSEKYEGGVHLLRGFSGGLGLNNLKVVIQRQDGRVEERNYSFTQGIQLNLLPGVVNFDLSTGVFRQGGLNSNSEYNTNLDSLTSLGSIRYGAHPYLTLEVFGLMNSYIQGAGGGFVWQQDSSSRTQFRLSTSLFNNTSLGYRGELTKMWFLGPTISGLSAAYQSGNYAQSVQNIATPGGTQVRNSSGQYLRDEKYVFRGNFLLQFLYFNFNSSVQANVNRPFSKELRNPVEYNFSANLSANPIQGLNLSVGGQANVVRKEYNPQININVTYFFGFEKHNFFAMNQLTRQKVFRPGTLERETISENQNFNGQDFLINRDTIIFQPGFREDDWLNATTLGWNWSQGLGFNGGHQFDITTQIQEDRYSVRASNFQTGNRGQFLASYNMNDYVQNDFQNRNHLASIRAETSLSFADGLINIGRPIRNNFVLVNTRKSLSHKEVQINPNGKLGSEYSKSWGLLAAQFGEILEYRPAVIQLGLDNPGPGVWLENTQYLVDAGYKRGYSLRVGEQISIIGRGRLLDATDSPVSRIAFVIVQADDPGKVVYESFTNKRGIFQAGNLEPGEEYLIRFGSDSFIEDLEIEVPSSAEGIYDFGKIKVNHQKM